MSLNGRYEVNEIIKFEAQFKELLKSFPERIALNLNYLEYIDSSGIGSLIRCMNITAHNNTKFVCFDLNETILSVFITARLDQYIPLLALDDFNSLFDDSN